MLREHLIATQAHDGHAAGSWFFAGGFGGNGGRLYNTAMAVTTLEVIEAESLTIYTSSGLLRH